MISVRRARPDDAGRLADLNRAFNGVERAPDGLAAALAAAHATETVLVAEESETLIGFLCLQTLRSMCYEAPWVEITELYVTPAHRGRGAGEALLREAVARATEAGASELLVRTNEANGPAQRLFERVGLERARQRVFRCVDEVEGRPV